MFLPGLVHGNHWLWDFEASYELGTLSFIDGSIQKVPLLFLWIR